MAEHKTLARATHRGTPPDGWAASMVSFETEDPWVVIPPTVGWWAPKAGGIYRDQWALGAPAVVPSPKLGEALIMHSARAPYVIPCRTEAEALVAAQAWRPKAVIERATLQGQWFLDGRAADGTEPLNSNTGATHSFFAPLAATYSALRVFDARTLAGIGVDVDFDTNGAPSYSYGFRSLTVGVYSGDCTTLAGQKGARFVGSVTEAPGTASPAYSVDLLSTVLELSSADAAKLANLANSNDLVELSPAIINTTWTFPGDTAADWPTLRITFWPMFWR